MKILFTLLLIIVGWASTTPIARAQVVNGGFEQANQLPQGWVNIASTPFNNPSDYDDLLNWQAVYGTPDYLHTSTRVIQSNPLFNVFDPQEPAYAPYTPHLGEGCVLLAASGTYNDKSYDERITQQITGLIPNHVYSAQFYVRRRPTTYLKRKLSLAVHLAVPQYVGSTPSTTPYKTIVSDYVADTDNWTLVSGEFVALQSSYWISIGYDNSNAIDDRSLSYSLAPGNQYTLAYALDDVSITDQGCYSPTPVITAQTREGFPIAQYGEVCWYKTLTFTVTGLSNVTWNVVAPSNQSAYQTAIDPNSPSQFKLKSFAPNFGGWRTETFYIEAYGTNDCGNPGSTTFQFESQNADANGGICPNAEDELRTAGAPNKGLATAYPNPANESLTLPAGVTEATLLNSQGKTVQWADETGNFDVRSLPAGLYNLQMRQDGKLINQRIEVKH